MKKSTALRLAGALIALIGLSRPVAATDLVMGVPDWSSANATAHVLGAIIEDRLGLKVGYKEDSNENIFGAMDRGEIDIHPEVWLPNHRQLSQTYVDKKRTVIMSARGIPAVQGMCTTKSTAEKHQITKISDLLAPEKVKLFDTNSDGKGEVWIGDKDWVSTRIERVRAKSYGYDKTMSLLVGAEDVAMAMVDVAAATGKPIVFYCYGPHHVFELHDIVLLEEPPHDPRKWLVRAPDQDPEWLANSDAAVAYDVSFLHIHYRSALDETHPKVAQLLANVELDTDTISAMTYALIVEKQDPDEFAKNWVAQNKSRVDGWMK